MSEVTQLLAAIKDGDEQAAADLFPLVYEELRSLARAHMAQERPGHTLQATALVHEAYLRLIGDADPHWDGRGHFFAAAAEAMRRILVDRARRKDRLKRGGDLVRQPLDDVQVAAQIDLNEILAVNEALEKLESQNALAAQVVKLRYFAGMTIPETAQAIGASPRKADQLWAYARAWLLAEMAEHGPPGGSR